MPEQLNNFEESETPEQDKVSAQLKKIAEGIEVAPRMPKALEKPKKMKGIKKWLGMSVVGAAALMGSAGCESKEQPSEKKQEVKQVDSQEGGFTDSVHDYARRQVELKKAERKFDKSIRTHKATPEEQEAARQAIKEMQEK